MNPILGAVFTVIALIVGLGVGVFAGITYRKKVAEAEIGSAEIQAKKIIDEGIKQAETKKKELLLEAKEDIIRAKNDNERDMKERRTELNQHEKMIVSNEYSL